MKKIKLAFAIIITIALVFISISINEVNSYLYAFIGISATWSWFNHDAKVSEIKEIYNTEVECNLKQRDKINSLEQELSLLRQKYSRTNQPRRGGKFVKKTKQVSVLSLKQICENNLGVARPSEMSNGEISKVCGYSLDYDCLIFGLDSYAGFTTFPDTSVIFNEYKSYEYGRL